MSDTRITLIYYPSRPPPTPPQSYVSFIHGSPGLVALQRALLEREPKRYKIWKIKDSEILFVLHEKIFYDRRR